MTFARPELLADALVAALVLAVQLWLLGRARREARRDHRSALAPWRYRFEADLVARARRGSAPDWAWYRAEIDRFFEPADDRLRVLSAAALASGLGGTIAALMLHLLPLAAGGAAEPWSVIPGMGVALFGSLAGVANHLAIALLLLPRAEARFGAASEEVLDELRRVEREHPPAENLIEAFREELVAVRQVLGEEFARSFSTAIHGFPEVVEGLGTHIERLAAVTERQAETVEGAVKELRSSARLVADASKRLQPAAEHLAESSGELVALPERMAAILTGGRHHWLEEIHEEHRKTLAELFRLLRDQGQESEKLRGMVAEIVHAVDELPERLKERLKEMSDSLGTSFGREARQTVRELQEAMKADHATVLASVDRREREWWAMVGHAVQKTLDSLSSEVDERLCSRLESVAGEFGRLTAGLLGAAERFESSHEAWRRAHEQALEGWQGVGERVDGAARVLAAGETSLGQAAAALGEGAGHLERVARLTAGFETTLLEALREIARGHLCDLQPVYAEIGRMVEALQAARNRSDVSIAPLISPPPGS